MEMFQIGFSQILNPQALLLIVSGVLVGIVFGSIPGMNGSMGIALMLPLTFSMSAVYGMSLLVSIYIGACSGGLISAILLRIPGTASSVATTFDGYPLAQRGEAGKALGVGIFFSFLGGTFSFIVLFFLAPPISRYALRFGPCEYFSIAIFSLTLISSLSGKSMVKGLLSGFLGMALSLAGIAPVEGIPRYTFGWIQLSGGFKTVPFLIGLFAVSEIITQAARTNAQYSKIKNCKIRGFGFTIKEFVSQIRNFLVSAVIGTGIGILPGIGGSTSNILAYSVSKNTSKQPEKYGSGIIDGIVASESANNASLGGALIPVLTLGIPGDATTALLIGALSIHGISAGPLLFVKHSDLVYAIFATLLVANLMIVLVEYFGIRIFVRALDIPKQLLFPIIMVLCFVGAFAVNNRVFDVWTVVLLGGIGVLLKALDFPSTPAILGFILCPIAELNLRKGLQLYDGSLSPFITQPISGVFLGLSLLFIALAIGKSVRANRRK